MVNNFKKHQFKSKYDGFRSAKRCHACLDCRHSQTAIYKECPECGSKNRQYFMSKKEFNRGMMLLTLQKAGTISNLRFQTAFPLMVNNKTIGKYVADFDYYDEDGNYQVEDVKGSEDHMTDLSKWKIKHFKIQNEIDVIIT